MFKGRHFDRSVILLCVRWYLAYNLSLRNLEEMMVERGISVCWSGSISANVQFPANGILMKPCI
jgi:transposase-like protein